MKLFTGWVMSAGLVLAVTAANAQVLAPYGVGRSPYAVVSDVGGPYAAMPEVAPAPGPGYGPTLLPPSEVYTVVRESGFSPLGTPQQRGLVYTISVIDRGGDDGRLVIDARTGRIIRFMPAYRMGDNFNDDLTGTYGPVGPGPLPPVSHVRGVPRPPLSIPRVASRTLSVPVPKASPPRAGEPTALAAKPAPETRPAPEARSVPEARPAPEARSAPEAKPVPEPAQAQQSAATQSKPADAQAAVPAVVEPKPAPQIKPTQAMPTVQGLD